ncbi:hypothetical protein [Lysobacter sp. HA35]
MAQLPDIVEVMLQASKRGDVNQGRKAHAMLADAIERSNIAEPWRRILSEMHLRISIGEDANTACIVKLRRGNPGLGREHDIAAAVEKERDRARQHGLDASAAAAKKRLATNLKVWDRYFPGEVRLSLRRIQNACTDSRRNREESNPE